MRAQCVGNKLPTLRTLLLVEVLPTQFDLL